MEESIPRRAGRTLWRLAATRLLAPILTEQLVYWRAERLYWEGVIHPDGGDREEEAEVYASEGAETAIRKLGDIFGIESLGGESLTHEAGRTRLLVRIEEDERAALETLDRLGPSRRIPAGEYVKEYLDAADAESMLDRLDRVAEYLEWLSGTERARADAGGRLEEEEEARR